MSIDFSIESAERKFAYFLERLGCDGMEKHMIRWGCVLPNVRSADYVAYAQALKANFRCYVVGVGTYQAVPQLNELLSIAGKIEEAAYAGREVALLLPHNNRAFMRKVSTGDGAFVVFRRDEMPAPEFYEAVLTALDDDIKEEKQKHRHTEL